MMNAAAATKAIAKAEQYIQRVPYYVNEYHVIEHHRNLIIRLWEGSYNDCISWVNATNNNTKGNVRIEPTTMENALCALGYGYEFVKGEFDAYLAAK